MFTWGKVTNGSTPVNTVTVHCSPLVVYSSHLLLNAFLNFSLSIVSASLNFRLYQEFHVRVRAQCGRIQCQFICSCNPLENESAPMQVCQMLSEPSLDGFIMTS